MRAQMRLQVVGFVLRWTWSQTILGRPSKYYQSINRIKTDPGPKDSWNKTDLLFDFQIDQDRSLFIIFDIMSPSDVFEKTVSQKQRLCLLREKALAERDLMWLRQQNQHHSFLIKTVVLFTVIFLACILVISFSAKHFSNLAAPLPHCTDTLFEAVNFFSPVCVHCQPPFQLQGGSCISS